MRELDDRLIRWATAAVPVGGAAVRDERCVVKLNAVKVQMQRVDGTIRTSYVYGPTAREYAAVMASNDGVTYKIISVRDAHGYKEEEGGRRRRPGQDQRPTTFFYSKHLGREPISSGAGPNLVGARGPGSSQEGVFQGQAHQERSDHHDGDAK